VSFFLFLEKEKGGGSALIPFIWFSSFRKQKGKIKKIKMKQKERKKIYLFLLEIKKYKRGGYKQTFFLISFFFLIFSLKRKETYDLYFCIFF
jgi:hypothetical protein